MRPIALHGEEREMPARSIGCQQLIRMALRARG